MYNTLRMHSLLENISYYRFNTDLIQTETGRCMLDWKEKDNHQKICKSLEIN